MRSLKSFCGAFVLAFCLSASVAAPAFAAQASGAIVGAPGAAAGEVQQGGNTKAEAAELKVTEDQGFVPMVPVPETTAAATKAAGTGGAAQGAAAETKPPQTSAAETKAATQPPRNLMDETAAPAETKAAETTQARTTAEAEESAKAETVSSGSVSLSAPEESAAASTEAETKAAQSPRNLMDETAAPAETEEQKAPETSPAEAPETEAKSPSPAETPEETTAAAPETSAAAQDPSQAATDPSAAAPDPNGPFRGVDTSEMDVTHGPGAPGAGMVTAGNHGVNEPTVTAGGASATDWSQISDTRERIVAMAKSFIGGTYVYGGSTPEGGFDCSGFVMYVMRNAAGVSLYHQSASQATSGRAVSASEMRPGDIIAYDGSNKDGVVNHVSIYVGDGKCVHAVGTGKGIRMTAWDYDTPFTIRNVLGD